MPHSTTTSSRKRCEGFLEEYLCLCLKYECSIEAEINDCDGSHEYNEIWAWKCPPGHVNVYTRETEDELRPHLPPEEKTDD